MHMMGSFGVHRIVDGHNDRKSFMQATAHLALSSQIGDCNLRCFRSQLEIFVVVHLISDAMGTHLHLIAVLLRAS